MNPQICVRTLRPFLQFQVRNASQSSGKQMKVAVLGACGSIGQPLSLLLKMNPLVQELAMYDIQYPQGAALDLAHVPTKCSVVGYGVGQLVDAVRDAQVVVCAAGSPRKSGLSRDEQFRLNAKVIKELAKYCSVMNPAALYCIVTNPINSTVPLFCEMFKKAGVLDERKIMGISNLGMMRANFYIAKEKGWDPATVSCPVIGGHSGVTIIPVVSQCKPPPNFSKETVNLVTHEVREAGSEIVEAKHGHGTVTMSIAWSAHEFVNSLLSAIKGQKGIVETAFVKTTGGTPLEYFSNQIELGPEGVAKNFGIPALNEYEKTLLDQCVPDLKLHIKAGEGAAMDKRPSIIPNAMVL